MSDWSSFEDDKKYIDAWRTYLTESEEEEIELDEGGCGDHGDYSDTEEMVIDDQPTDDVDIVLALEPEDDDVEMVDLSTGEFKLGNIFSL